MLQLLFRPRSLSLYLNNSDASFYYGLFILMPALIVSVADYALLLRDLSCSHSLR